jgi:hypothetical protein
MVLLFESSTCRWRGSSPCRRFRPTNDQISSSSRTRDFAPLARSGEESPSAPRSRRGGITIRRYLSGTEFAGVAGTRSRASVRKFP